MKQTSWRADLFYCPKHLLWARGRLVVVTICIPVSAYIYITLYFITLYQWEQYYRTIWEGSSPQITLNSRKMARSCCIPSICWKNLYLMMRAVSPQASFTPMPFVHIHEFSSFQHRSSSPSSVLFFFPRLVNCRCFEFTDFCLFMSLKENVGKQKLFLAVDGLSGCFWLLFLFGFPITTSTLILSSPLPTHHWQ